MTHIVTASISEDFWKLATDNKISWSEAMRIGLSVMFGDLGVKEYDNSINIYRKMRVYQQQLQETATKMAELEEKRGALLKEAVSQ